jgi:hypothetical protein
MITSSLKKMVFGYITMNVFMIVFKKKQTLDRFLILSAWVGYS